MINKAIILPLLITLDLYHFDCVAFEGGSTCLFFSLMNPIKLSYTTSFTPSLKVIVTVTVGGISVYTT